MYQINQISNAPLQTMTLILPNGNQMNMTLYFRPQQLGWFINNLTYQSFVLNGVRITNCSNILYPWKNILPFGLACYSNMNREPTQQNDFMSLNSILYILDAAEVEQLTTIYQGG